MNGLIKQDSLGRGSTTHVPVKMMSPGNSVVPCDKNEIVFATLNIISLVEDSCTILPFSLVLIRNAWGSPMSLEDTIPGPNGAQPSSNQD